MTTNKVSSESPFYFQLVHVNNIWIIKTVFMQNGYRLQWYGIFPPFLIRYLAQLGLLVLICEIYDECTYKCRGLTSCIAIFSVYDNDKRRTRRKSHDICHDIPIWLKNEVSSHSRSLL